MFIPCHFVQKSVDLSKYVGRLTKKECIQYLKNCKSMVGLQQIHSQIIKVGLHQDVDALDKLIVFCADTSLGNVPYAERIFNYAEYPSLFIYNVMIKAYAKNSSFKKSVLLFDELRIQGLWPDNFTYPFVLKAVAEMSDVLLGRKIHGFAVKSGAEFDCYVCNSLMDMYAELGHLEYVNKLFDEMSIRDVVSWNVLISGYVKCHKFEEAVNVFTRMRSVKGIKPDEATVVSTLSACTSLKRLDLGKEIHSYVNDELGFTPIISNAILDMYSKCGHLSIARQIFDGMPVKNVICWTAMVSGYVSCGQLDEARSLFERSPSKDIILWTTMINGYVQFNRFDEAIALFHQMQIKRVKPDKFTLVALLTGCAQSGALEQGRWIHRYIELNRIKFDAIVCTSLIDMYAKCGCVVKSLEVFNQLNRQEKDTASWTSIICGLALNGQTDRALDLFSEMKRDGFRPDDITFIGVLTACSHGGLVDEGLIQFESMKRNYRIEPKLEHYGCMIDLLGRSGRLDEAEEMIKSVENENEENEIVIPIFGALLSACRTYGNVEMGERLAKKLTEIETNDSSVHTLLANIYASANRWADVTKVRRRMRNTGVKKEPGCSSIEVDGNIHEFLVRDSSHLEIQHVHSMLHSITKVVSSLGELEIEEDL